MAARTAVWYTVGRTPNGMFEKEIMSICNRVSRPCPVIKGAKEHQGVERPWSSLLRLAQALLWQRPKGIPDTTHYA